MICDKAGTCLRQGSPTGSMPGDIASRYADSMQTLAQKARHVVRGLDPAVSGASDPSTHAASTHARESSGPGLRRIAEGACTLDAYDDRLTPHPPSPHAPCLVHAARAELPAHPLRQARAPRGVRCVVPPHVLQPNMEQGALPASLPLPNSSHPLAFPACVPRSCRQRLPRDCHPEVGSSSIRRNAEAARACWRPTA